VVPQDGRFVARKLMSLSLAVDHRVLNGVYAARFLSCVAEQLTDFERLM
jgi:pyruvate/2-oxoglutarate dehydrogenase complex dihydrolipoamide acyltransferase (E2) component